MNKNELEIIKDTYGYKQLELVNAWIDFKYEFIKSLPISKKSKKYYDSKQKKEKKLIEKRMEDYMDSFN